MSPADGHLPPVPPIPRRTHPLVRLVALGSRFLLNGWCSSVKVRGLDRFVALLKDEERKKRGRGILTYANHISVMDDPTLFGCMPKDVFQSASTTRWTLGASDIMFTNSVFSYFFKTGQVLSTDRGRGVFQPSIDKSIDLLENGGWVHIFPEGYVNMSRKMRCRRFKWGVGRMLLEAGRKTQAKHERSSNQAEGPVIIPIWLTGLDSMMPEPRANPRWFPRPGASVTITIGEPVNPLLDPLVEALASLIQDSKASSSTYDSVQDTLSQRALIPLSKTYPLPPERLFPATTPLVPPPGAMPWPVPLPESRSAKALEKGADTLFARQARSLVANELRAHLVRLGEATRSQSDVPWELVHRVMEEEEKDNDKIL